MTVTAYLIEPDRGKTEPLVHLQQVEACTANTRTYTLDQTYSTTDVLKPDQVNWRRCRQWEQVADWPNDRACFLHPTVAMWTFQQQFDARFRETAVWSTVVEWRADMEQTGKMALTGDGVGPVVSVAGFGLACGSVHPPSARCDRLLTVRLTGTRAARCTLRAALRFLTFR